MNRALQYLECCVPSTWYDADDFRAPQALHPVDDDPFVEIEVAANQSERKRERRERAITLLRGVMMTKRDLAMALKVSNSTAEVLIQDLRAEGIVVPAGFVEREMGQPSTLWKAR